MSDKVKKTDSLSHFWLRFFFQSSQNFEEERLISWAISKCDFLSFDPSRNYLEHCLNSKAILSMHRYCILKVNSSRVLTVNICLSVGI